MKPATWTEAWAVLPSLVSLCHAADIGTLAAVLADRQQRGDAPPAEIVSPDRAYIHVSWPGGEQTSINAGRLFVHPAKARKRA